MPCSVFRGAKSLELAYAAPTTAGRPTAQVEVHASCRQVQSPGIELWEVTKAGGLEVAPEFCHRPEAK